MSVRTQNIQIKGAFSREDSSARQMGEQTTRLTGGRGSLSEDFGGGGGLLVNLTREKDMGSFIQCAPKLGF